MTPEVAQTRYARSIGLESTFQAPFRKDSLLNVVAFIFAFVVFCLGIWLFGFAFTVDSGQALIFFAGILAVSASVAIPVHVLKD